MESSITSGLRRLQLVQSSSSSSSTRERRFSDTADQTTSPLSPLPPHLRAISPVNSEQASPASGAEAGSRSCRWGVDLHWDGPWRQLEPEREPSPPPPTSSVPLERHECPASECAVLRAFETTELLEIILSYLDTTNLLTLRRTKSKWNAITYDSPTLRIHHFVNPRWSLHPKDFQLLDLKLQGLSIEAGEPLDQGHWIHVKMSAAAARQITPPDTRSGRRLRSRSIFEGLRGGFGSRVRPAAVAQSQWPTPQPREPRQWYAGDSYDRESTVRPREMSTVPKYESLFIAQPPVLGMQAFVVETSGESSASDHGVDDSDEPGPSACAKLHCDAGITLGFLAETTISLLSEKPTSGADRTVLFKAIISFASPAQAPRKRGTTRSVTRIA